MKSSTIFFSLLVATFPVKIVIAEETAPTETRIRAAVERSLPLLERASAGTAAQRTCFTCHGQAQPVIALVESQRRGFHTAALSLALFVRFATAAQMRVRVIDLPF